MRVSPIATNGGLLLVTGAGRFIGGHLMARLRAEGRTRIRGVDITPWMSGTSGSTMWRM